MKKDALVFWASFALVSIGCDRPVSTSTSTPSSTANAAAAEASPSAIATASAAVSASASAAPRAGTGKVTFDAEAPGGPSTSFEGVVGEWYVADLAGARGLKVDGGRWRENTPSANLADQAKRLYGDRYAEFLDGVKAFAFFPLAVWKGEAPSPDVRISVRFYPEAGKIDQGAGIAFGVTPDGSYFGARANALENNILFFHVVKGRRTVIDDVRNVPTPSKTWHTLAVELRGKHLAVELDGQQRFEKALDAAPVGRVGLWSKADSQVLFDDFAVEPLSSP